MTQYVDFLYKTPVIRMYMQPYEQRILVLTTEIVQDTLQVIRVSDADDPKREDITDDFSEEQLVAWSEELTEEYIDECKEMADRANGLY